MLQNSLHAFMIITFYQQRLRQASVSRTFSIFSRGGKKGKTKYSSAAVYEGFTMKDRTPDKLTPEQWAAVIQGLESRPSTINDYRKVLNLLHSFENGAFHIFEMTKEQAEAYFRYLDSRLADGTLSENTVHRYKATLRSLGARIEHHKTVCPGYVNPFSRLVTNENRKRTEYRENMFLAPETVQKLRSAFPRFAKEDRLILTMMMNLGLTPAQIHSLKINDFFTLSGQTETLAVRINEGDFIEMTSSNWKDSPYYTNDYPVHYVRKSPNRSITWNYTGTYIFQPKFTEQLRDYYEYIGASTDMRSFFLTARHLEFNYRAMHHMILNCCKIADIDPSTITPNMISRFGMIHSYLIFTCTQEAEALKQQIAEAPEEAKAELSAKLEETERLLSLHKADGFIGDWQDRFPIPLQERIDSIIRHLGTDFLNKAVGH